MRATSSARLAALVLFATLFTAACEATTYSAAPPTTPSLVAGIRSNFKAHWNELLADPSPAAARTRAEVIAWAFREDPELLQMLETRESIALLIARGTADATKATEAFPDAADAWMSLAHVRVYAGDRAAALAAACRAYKLDATNMDAWYMCKGESGKSSAGSLEAADKAAAKTLVENDLHVALRAAARRVATACKRSPRDLSWAELVACGDDDAGHGRTDNARIRYRAAALTTTNDEAQFLALQRIEEIDGSCRDVLDLLPLARSAEYERWKTSLSAKLRPPLR